MPELPDVEGSRSVLESCGRNRTVQRVTVHDSGVLNGVSAHRLRQELEGRKFTRSERHGKWLVARTGGPALLLHFGMTGRLVCAGPDDERHPHDRVVFTLGRGQELRYRDQRKLKGLWLLDDAGVADALEGQGPDALRLSRREWDETLSGRRGGAKAVLTDQSVVAGLGNLLADEVLWRARIDPRRSMGGLTDEERHGLYTQLRRTLRAAVPAQCVPPRRSWLTGHRDSRDCPRCGRRLSSGRITGRTTVWCPACQPEHP